MTYRMNELTEHAVSRTNELLDEIEVLTEGTTFEDPTVLHNCRYAINQIVDSEPLIFVYISKFIHRELTPRQVKLVLSTVIAKTGDNKNAVRLTSDSEYIYSSIEEYDSVFTSGVPGREIEFLWRKHVLPSDWVTVDTLYQFTRATEAVPEVEFDLRWLLASGEEDE